LRTPRLLGVAAALVDALAKPLPLVNVAVGAPLNLNLILSFGGATGATDAARDSGAEVSPRAEGDSLIVEGGQDATDFGLAP